MTLAAKQAILLVALCAAGLLMGEIALNCGAHTGEAHGVITFVDQRSLPGDCAIVATEAYSRVAKAASWARLLALDLQKEGGHMVCVWQVEPNDPILVYDKFLLHSSTMELQTSQRDAKVIADKLRDVIGRDNWKHGKVIITAAHFVEKP